MAQVKLREKYDKDPAFDDQKTKAKPVYKETSVSTLKHIFCED